MCNLFSVCSLQGREATVARHSRRSANQRIPQFWGLRAVQLTGTRGTNTRGSVSSTGTVPVPTAPGTCHQVLGSQSDGVQLYYTLLQCRPEKGFYIRCAARNKTPRKLSGDVKYMLFQVVLIIDNIFDYSYEQWESVVFFSK